MNVKALALLMLLSPAIGAKCIPAALGSVEALILEAAIKYQIDPDLVWAKAKTESDLNSCAVSKAGAIGVMQLMPKTANALSVIDSFDAAQNIDAGTRYLALMIAQFRVPQLYLAAYNAGPKAVLKKGYVPNYKETRRHLRKVLKHYQTKRGINDDFEALQQLSIH